MKIHPVQRGGQCALEADELAIDDPKAKWSHLSAKARFPIYVWPEVYKTAMALRNPAE